VNCIFTESGDSSCEQIFTHTRQFESDHSKHSTAAGERSYPTVAAASSSGRSTGEETEELFVVFAPSDAGGDTARTAAGCSCEEERPRCSSAAMTVAARRVSNGTKYPRIHSRVRGSTAARRQRGSVAVREVAQLRCHARGSALVAALTRHRARSGSRRRTHRRLSPGKHSRARPWHGGQP